MAMCREATHCQGNGRCLKCVHSLLGLHGIQEGQAWVKSLVWACLSLTSQGTLGGPFCTWLST